MRSRAFSIIFEVICLISLVVLSACSEDKSSKSWSVFGSAIQQELEQLPKEKSISELVDVFSVKYALLIKIVAICEDNPAIRRVGIKSGEVSFYGKELELPDFESVVDVTRAVLTDLAALSVDCGRRGDFDGNPLAVVSFVMHSSGLSVSGGSSGFVYKTEWSRNKKPITAAQIESWKYTKLDKQGWYIYRD